MAPEKDDERLTEAKRALKTLEQVRKSAVEGDGVKQAAREKVEQLKERLKNLRMFGGSPREIAQLAKELAQAVKSYASAGGSAADIGGSASDSGGAGAEAASSESGGATGEAAAHAAGAPAPTEAAGEPAIEEQGADTDRTTPTDEQSTQNPYQKALDAQREADGRSARSDSDDQADREFMTAAKLLAKQIKQMARDAARKPGATPEAKEAAKAADAAEQAVSAAERQLQAGTVVVIA